jgi:UDP-glucose 4-epimerase
MPSREDDRCLPVSPYGVTKLAGEHLCRLYSRNFGVNALSLRFFTVYGPRQRPDMAFHRFFRAYLKNGTIKIFGDGEQSRDFTYVGDVVNGCIRAVESRQGAGRVYNLGGGSRASINQVLESVERLTEGHASIDRQAVALGDVRHTWADTSRLKEDFDFTPSTGLEKGLAAQLEWMREALPVLVREVEA